MPTSVNYYALLEQALTTANEALALAIETGGDLTSYLYLPGRVGNQTIKGGTTATGYLKLVSTAAAGTTDYISLCVGTDGGTEAVRAIHSGFVGINTAVPTGMLTVARNQAQGYVVLKRTDQEATYPNPQFDVDSGSFVISPETGLGWLNKTITLEGAALDGTGTQIFDWSIGRGGLYNTGNDIVFCTFGTSTYLKMTAGSLVLTGDGDPTFAILADGVWRFRQKGATRYRGDFQVSSSGVDLASYDDTAGAYLPQVYNGSTWSFRPSSSAATRVDILSSGSLQLVASAATSTMNGSLTVGTNTVGANRLSVFQAGTATADTQILSLTNSGNAAAMTNTRTSILFNQWYYDAGTPAVADAASITVGTEGNWTSTASTQDAYMAFSVAVDGTVTERGRFTSAGFLGVGITPTSTFHIYSAEAKFTFHSASAASQYQMICGGGLGVAAGEFQIFNSAIGGIPLRVIAGAGNSATGTLVIDNGKVGINLASPTYYLDVAGNCRLNPSTTPQTALLLDIAAPAAGDGVEVLVNSHIVDLRTRMRTDATPGVQHYSDWQIQAKPVTALAGASVLQFGLSVDGTAIGTKYIEFGTAGGLGVFGHAAPASQPGDPGTATGTDAAVINAIKAILQGAGLCA